MAPIAMGLDRLPRFAYKGRHEMMDEPAFPGCVLKCRLIGIIEGEQGDKKEKERNDRVVAVEKDNHSWADTKVIDDLGKQFLRELEEFFVNYHELIGEQYQVRM